MKTTWWNRLKCAMGWHDWVGDYIDDGKGNSGMIMYCYHCPATEIV